MSKDEELARWQEEWQSLGDEAGLAKELVARAERDGRKLKISAAREVLGAAFAAAVSAWLVVFTKGKLEVVVVAIAIALFSGAWITHFFTVRAGTFAASGQGIEAFVALTRARMAAATRWNRYAMKWNLVLATLLVPWSVWVFIAHLDAYLAAPWRAVVGFGGWVAIMAGLMFFLRVKAKRLRAEEEAFERELAEAALV